MARVMIHSKDLPRHFWGEAVSTACHIINRVYLRPETTMSPYEIWKGRKPTVKYFRVFGSPCYILQDRENLGKFDTKSDEGTFLSYSSNSHAYKVFNHQTNTVMESINVVVNDDSSSPKEEMLKEEVVQTIEVNSDQEVSTLTQRHLLKKLLVRVEKNHPSENIVGNMNEGLRLRNRVVNHITYSCHLSMLEPKEVEKALEDER